MVFPFFVCVHLNIFVREGGNRGRTTGTGNRGRERGTGGTVSLRTPHPKTTEVQKIPKKSGTEGTKSPPPPKKISFSLRVLGTWYGGGPEYYMYLIIFLYLCFSLKKYYVQVRKPNQKDVRENVSKC